MDQSSLQTFFIGSSRVAAVVLGLSLSLAADAQEQDGENTAQKPLNSPIAITSTHQLFVDMHLVDKTDGLGLVVNQPVKYWRNPVLTYTEPWEGNCVIMWGSVLYDNDEKLFKAWYFAYKKFAKKGEYSNLLCYATSSDGIHWDKPDLGLVEVQGTKSNNVIHGKAHQFDSPSIFLNPITGEADRKYLMVWFDNKLNGVRMSHSADGIHWNHPEKIIVNSGDRTTAGYDPIRKKFQVITRIYSRPTRTCGLWESSDGKEFEFVKEIAAADNNDPERTEFYGMYTFPYAGIHLGMLEVFDVESRTLHTQLMHSRNGTDWNRTADRQVFLDIGPRGAWDGAWVFPSQNPPILVDDELYVFYQARQTLHWSTKPFGHIGSVGLAVMRPDGFVSLEPIEPLERSNTTHGYQGTAITKPLLLQGSELHLNAIARPGSVRVAVLDHDGNEIEGFTRDDCVGIQMEDSLDYTVKWKGGRSLESLAEREVRLKLHIQAARLYSLWME